MYYQLALTYGNQGKYMSTILAFQEALKLKVELEHQEWQGDHVLLHLTGTHGSLVAKRSASEMRQITEGDVFEVEAFLSHCHFFGGLDNRNLRLASP